MTFIYERMTSFGVELTEAPREHELVRAERFGEKPVDWFFAQYRWNDGWIAVQNNFGLPIRYYSAVEAIRAAKSERADRCTVEAKIAAEVEAVKLKHSREIAAIHSKLAD